MSKHDQHLQVESIFGLILVRLLKPTSDTALVAHIATMKFEAGEIEDDGEVYVTAQDLAD